MGGLAAGDAVRIRNFAIFGEVITNTITANNIASATICQGSNVNLNISNIGGGSPPYRVDWVGVGASPFDCFTIPDGGSCSVNTNPGATTTFNVSVIDTLGCS